MSVVPFAWSLLSEILLVETDLFYHFMFPVCFFSVMGSAFFTILYSMEWGADLANKWLATFVMGFFEDVVLVQPIKVNFPHSQCVFLFSSLSLILTWSAPREDLDQRAISFLCALDSKSTKLALTTAILVAWWAKMVLMHAFCCIISPRPVLLSPCTLPPCPSSISTFNSWCLWVAIPTIEELIWENNYRFCY